MAKTLTDRTGDPYNAAIAEQFQIAATRQRKTKVMLVRETGITTGTLGRILLDQRQISVSQFAKLTRALGLNPSTVVDNAERWVAEQGGAGDPVAAAQSDHVTNQD